jgi:SAM-dependent methyltransferase
VLSHVELEPAFRELARVVRPGGRVLVYQTFATAALEPEERARLFAATACAAESMEPRAFEDAAEAAGFDVLSVDPIDSEWRESMIEAGSWSPADDLLEIARLRRREAELVERHGAAACEAARGGALWGIYQLLGKLCPTVYTLERRGG